MVLLIIKSSKISNRILADADHFKKLKQEDFRQLGDEEIEDVIEEKGKAAHIGMTLKEYKNL